MGRQRIIAITVRRNEHGFFVAESDDLPGLYLVHEKRQAVLDDLDEAIVQMHAAMGEKVQASTVAPPKAAETANKGLIWELVRPLSLNGATA
jgi:hypothetical protein